MRVTMDGTSQDRRLCGTGSISHQSIASHQTSKLSFNPALLERWSRLGQWLSVRNASGSLVWLSRFSRLALSIRGLANTWPGGRAFC